MRFRGLSQTGPSLTRATLSNTFYGIILNCGAKSKVIRQPPHHSTPKPRKVNTITPETVKKTFGVDPRRVGFAALAWQIIKEPSAEDIAVGAKSGYLVVRTMDKAFGRYDEKATWRTNFIGFTNDMFELERTNYYFRPLENGL